MEKKHRKGGKKNRKFGRNLRKPSFCRYWRTRRFLRRLKRHLQLHPNDHQSRRSYERMSEAPVGLEK